MKVAWFDTEKWERSYLEEKNHDMEIDFFEEPLNKETVGEAEGYDAVTVFVSSQVDEKVIEELDAKLIACRSTGFDHVDLEKASARDISVCNVPNYGSATVAEHTFGLIVSLSRRIYDAVNKVENGSFSHEGLKGFDLEGKTLGVIGTGGIGLNVIQIANGFQMEVIASDPEKKPEKAEELGFNYVELDKLLEESDIVSLHCPLIDATHHLLSEDEFEKMKETTIVNTARGGLIDTDALVEALDENKVKAAGLDVLEGDSKTALEKYGLTERDDILVTPHNAFNTQEAMKRINDTTLKNLEDQENVVN